VTEYVATAPNAGNALVQWLYDAYAAPLVAYVTGLTSDPHAAEDVVQEAMLRAWRHADTLSPDRGSLWGWLSRVAHNIVVDRGRARRARPAEVAESAVSVAASQAPDHAEEIASWVAMSDALRRLSPDHRAVLYQVYYLDRTAAMAAAELGIPVGTVKSRLHKAIRQLRVALAQDTAGPHTPPVRPAPAARTARLAS
jgi:RNA polymerase sigma-70 factor, ECF subfamily